MVVISVITELQESAISYDKIRFSFERFLEDNQENLPEGLDPQYLSYVKLIENPLRNIRKLPRAINTLPMNAILYQKWNVMLKLIGLIILLGSPSLFLLIQTGFLYDKPLVGVFLVIFILVGVFAAPAYLKIMYIIFNNMVDSKTNIWLIESIEKPFNDAYQTQWNRKFLGIAFVIPFVIDIQLITFNLMYGANLFRYNLLVTIFWFLALIIGHLGLSLMLYISILSYRYVSKNTRIYDLLLIKITERVRGYNEGHETILSKKNYEVVGVLSDTPGLSIRSLGDIPIIGLLSSTAAVNAVILLVIGPAFLRTEWSGFYALRGDTSGITFILLIGIGISMLAAFGAVIIPIIRMWWIIRKFKSKGLSELDPFLFDEITEVALKRDKEISNETRVLYMLRNYIYSMKVSPVNPLRLLYIALLVSFYIWKGAPGLGKLIG